MLFGSFRVVGRSATECQTGCAAVCATSAVAWLEWAVERQVGCGAVVARTMDHMDPARAACTQA